MAPVPCRAAELSAGREAGLAEPELVAGGQSIALTQRAVPILLFLLLWQALGSFRIVDVEFLPTPIMVARALGELLAGREIRDNLAATLLRTFAGLGAGALAGVWLGAAMARSPVFRATPLDMKAEADRHFLMGINQLIGHGWPYTSEGVDYPGWRFYAAAVFDEKNPWWIVMPDIASYLQRSSYLLRQGTPVNDVALYLPNDDGYAHFTSGNPHLIEIEIEGKR